MAYQLYYWDGIQGRGEFVRLALEEAGADYVDIAREPGRGTGAMFDIIESESEAHIPFAPPFLKDGDLIIPHVANILFYLGPRLGLAPRDEGLRHVANGLQLTVTDLVAEVHDTHHPIDMGRYYEEQKQEAKARSAAFIGQRIPKYLGYFERVLRQNPDGSGHIVGDALTYVDLSLFQVIEGLTYAFPRPWPDARPITPPFWPCMLRWKSGRTSPAISPPLAASPSTRREFSGIIPSSTARNECAIHGSGTPHRRNRPRDRAAGFPAAAAHWRG